MVPSDRLDMAQAASSISSYNAQLMMMGGYWRGPPHATVRFSAETHHIPPKGTVHGPAISRYPVHLQKCPCPHVHVIVRLLFSLGLQTSYLPPPLDIALKTGI